VRLIFKKHSPVGYYPCSDWILTYQNQSHWIDGFKGKKYSRKRRSWVRVARVRVVLLTVSWRLCCWLAFVLLVVTFVLLAFVLLVVTFVLSNDVVQRLCCWRLLVRVVRWCSFCCRSWCWFVLLEFVLLSFVLLVGVRVVSWRLYICCWCSCW